MPLPFNGGRVRNPETGLPWTYPTGFGAWRCSWCGAVGPWQDGWGGYWSPLQEDDGLMSDHGAGYPVWCGPTCAAKVAETGACARFEAPVFERKKKR